MPFVRKNGSKDSQPPTDARNIFIGRSSELYFFREHILRPLEPSHNIISIAGHGGVGKSTLLARFIEETRNKAFSDYCLTALVDERQVTPVQMMEKFAEQLQIAGEFKKTLARYKALVSKPPTEQETMRIQDTLLHKAPDLAGAAVEGIPLVGGILRESGKMAAGHIVHEYHAGQAQKDAQQLEDPVGDLTMAFVEEVNSLADMKVSLNTPTGWVKREQRVILFFDSFEQLAAEATPWLLDDFLEASISGNVVLVMAGRTSIERATPDGPKRWLRYRDTQVMHTISLNSFTQEETRIYLAQRGINDPERVDLLWRLSRGLPLYLSLLTYNPAGEVDPTANVVANFLQWIPEHEEVKRRLALDAALFSKAFNQDDLAAFSYISEHERANLYDWLIQQPFVRSSLQDGRHSYHELAQELFARHLYQLSPSRCHATRKALVKHYQHQLELELAENELAADSTEFLELTLALAYQLFLIPGEINHIKAIEQCLDAYEHTRQVSEIVRLLRELLLEQANSQVSTDTRESARQLLLYIEADRLNQEFFTATKYLLEKIAHEPSFSPQLLASIYHKRGITYRLLGNYTLAIEDFNQALNLHPQNARIYGSRGIAYSFSENYQHALEDFNLSLSLESQSAWTYASRGKTYFLLKDYKRALQDFDQALALDPNYAWAYANRAKTYFVLKEYEKAMADYNQAIAFGPNYTWAYLKRGETYLLLNEYHRAIADYDRAITLDPNYAWTYGERGRTHRLLGDYQRANADYDLAITLDPKNAWAYSGRGEVYRLQGIYVQALQDLDHAISLQDNDAWVYRHRGLTHLSLNNYRPALKDFSRAIELAPGHANAYNYRGIAYLYLDDLEHARADFVHSQEMDATLLRASWLIEWVDMCRQSNEEQRIERLEAIAERDPEHYIAHLCRGVADWLGESYELALAEIEQSLAMQPRRWDAYFWRAMAYVPLGWENYAFHALAHAQTIVLPPVMFAPLKWLTADKPEFYEKCSGFLSKL